MPFNERMPKIGETVLFTPNPDDTVAKSNGNDYFIAAIVTRVWSSVCVNLKIIPDHGPMQDRGSVSHFSANPVGYSFRFMEEVYSESPVISDFTSFLFEKLAHLKQFYLTEEAFAAHLMSGEVKISIPDLIKYQSEYENKNIEPPSSI